MRAFVKPMARGDLGAGSGHETFHCLIILCFDVWLDTRSEARLTLMAPMIRSEGALHDCVNNQNAGVNNVPCERKIASLSIRFALSSWKEK